MGRAGHRKIDVSRVAAVWAGPSVCRLVGYGRARASAYTAAVADLEHLKLIQAVISRMAANSFVLKGWAVTLVTGLAALAKADGNDDIAWISLGVLFVFALLDGYYLALERAYRKLYQATIEGKTTLYSLKLDATPGPVDVVRAVGSFAIWPLYGAAAVGAIVVATGAI